MKKEAHKDSIEKLIQAIDKGVKPWVAPFGRPTLRRAENFLTKTKYQGVNSILLLMEAYAGGFSSNSWLTYKQIATLKGKVRKGEVSTRIFFFTYVEKKDDETKQVNPDKEIELVPRWKYFNVFNVDQTEGLVLPETKNLGELLQGVLPSNRNFLVTFPANVYSYVKFSFHGECELSVLPLHKKKAVRMAKNILEHFSLPLAGHLVIESEIPEGKGMASSSADLVAVAKAVSDAYQLDLSSAIIEKFMSEIEPSDGVMYDACVSYYQREAMLRSYLGALPNLMIISVDEGGEIDTVEFSKKAKSFSHAEKYEYALLLEQLENAVRKSDAKAIGRIATRSAILNQKLKLNKYLNEFIEINQRVGGLGVAIAHSGTCIGLLLDGNNLNVNEQVAKAKLLLNEFSIFEDIQVFQRFTEYNHQNFVMDKSKYFNC